MIQVTECFGCGLCAVVCPCGALEIKLNRQGFFTPAAYPERCIKCGLCERVCPLRSRREAAAAIGCLAGWSLDPAVRSKSSSGGIGFELARAALRSGYRVCAAGYDAASGTVRHFVADHEDQLGAAAGSKYLQSFTFDAFAEFRKPGRFAVFGTPCQIAGVREYAELKKRTEDFLLIDFFCHGVPSLRLWQKYLAGAEAATGPVRRARWRTKDLRDWHDSYAIALEGDKGALVSGAREGDLFYRFFLGGLCRNPSCVKDCRFQGMSSAADLRLGDAWGEAYGGDSCGVSAVAVYREAGQMLLDRLENCRLEPYPALVRDKGKHATAYCPPAWRYALDRLAGTGSLRSVWVQVKMLTPFFRLRNRIARLFARN